MHLSPTSKLGYLSFKTFMVVISLATCLYRGDEAYSLFQTFRQSSFCDSFYEFFFFFFITVIKLKTSSRRV